MGTPLQDANAHLAKALEFLAAAESEVSVAVAPTLERLLKLKTRAQYQTTSMANKDAESAVKWASHLCDAAEGVVNA